MQGSIQKIEVRSKTRIVEEWLRAEIESGRLKEGDKLPAEYDLARDLGVAYMTVRAGLEPLVRDGLLQRIRGKGTFVTTAAPKEVGVQTIALMVPSFPTLWTVKGLYFPRIVQGFSNEAYRQDLDPAIVGRPKNLFSGNPAAIQPYSGIACLLLDSDSLAAIDVLRQTGVPLVAINLYRGQGQISSVNADIASGIVQGVEHLIALGHTNIAFLRGPIGNLDSEERYRAFQETMQRHGAVEFPVDIAAEEFTEEHGAVLGHWMLAQPKMPTAIVATSDLIAAGAMEVFKNAGLRIPQDLSIVGFGDFEVASQTEPPLTTVRLPLEDLGAAAVMALQRILSGKGSLQTIQLPTTFVPRDSTEYRR